MKTMASNHSRPISSLLLLPLLLSTYAALSNAQNSADNSPDPNAPYRFNPSMLIIIFVLISAFFFMGFFSIYIRQCAGESLTVQGNGNNGGRGRSRRAMRGLDPAVIATFPVLEYSVVKGLKLGKGTLECAVCLNEFEDDETLRLLPKCSHVFHPECIDAWLASHTTCPVCRANLVPGNDAEAATASVATDPVAVAGEETQSPPDHVAIAIEPAISSEGGETQPDVINPRQMPFQIQNRPIRSKSSRRPARFPRSHSTGHSLVQPGENVDRFTLRLPEHVRKEIVSGHLKRTTSLVAFPTEGGSVSGGSSRGGRYRGGGGGEGGEGSSRGRSGFQFGRFDWAARSDRWVFSMTPPFVSRTGSVKSQKRADGEMTGSSRGVLTSVKTPFDCLGAKNGGEASEPEPTRASTPVFTVSSQ